MYNQSAHPQLHAHKANLIHQLASEYAMCMQCLLENLNPTLVFETKSGDLAVTRQGDGYVMDFPLNPPTKEVCGQIYTFMSQEHASPTNNSYYSFK